jgi:hypothetical protein
MGFGTLGEEDWWWCSIIEGRRKSWGFIFFHCERVEVGKGGRSKVEGRKGGKSSGGADFGVYGIVMLRCYIVMMLIYC